MYSWMNFYFLENTIFKKIEISKKKANNSKTTNK